MGGIHQPRSIIDGRGGAGIGFGGSLQGERATPFFDQGKQATTVTVLHDTGITRTRVVTASGQRGIGGIGIDDGGASVGRLQRPNRVAETVELKDAGATHHDGGEVADRGGRPGSQPGAAVVNAGLAGVGIVAIELPETALVGVHAEFAAAGRVDQVALDLVRVRTVVVAPQKQCFVTRHQILVVEGASPNEGARTVVLNAAVRPVHRQCPVR